LGYPTSRSRREKHSRLMGIVGPCMHKLSWLEGSEWVEHSHPPTFAVERTRVVVGVPRGDPEVFARLLTSLEAPYFLLYVLHTPRGEGRAGRYQSPSLAASQVWEFIDRFKRLLSQDARFDIWGHSPRENGTVVWERHNLLYAYGRVDGFVRELRALGFNAAAPSIPTPHSHSYHPELDTDARDLLTSLEWSWSKLRPEDEQ
jgi:hypothetical protein